MQQFTLYFIQNILPGLAFFLASLILFLALWLKTWFSEIVVSLFVIAELGLKLTVFMFGVFVLPSRNIIVNYLEVQINRSYMLLD